ncbi:HAMP domain-containing sensor histidine kinase [Methyloglobulus sp.]|uniref:sensor histidine kinase n=1 Tax=Methyloglobulus sp. TaxID=2518622 RepID=UPI0032B710D5
MVGRALFVCETALNINKKGLQYKLIKAFLLQVTLISIATALAVFAAAKVVEDVLIRKALQGEATHFWALYLQNPNFPKPNTLNLNGYLVVNNDKSKLPKELQQLKPGYFRTLFNGRHPIVYVEDHGNARLFLVFDEEQVNALAFYFGIVPLSVVLILIYLFAWLSYRQTKHAISPVIKLAEIVEHFDFKSHSFAELDLGEVRKTSDSDVAKLIEALDHFTERSQLFIEREQNFTRDASHELRTPLAVIKSSLGLLQKRKDFQPNEQQSLLMIEKTLVDMEGLIETLLLLAREESSPMPEESVLINDLLSTLVEQVQRALGNNKISIEIAQHCLLSVPAAEKVLTILFTNLLRNAFRYTPSGMISVSIDKQQVSVSDTGIGMEQQQLEKVFDPFYRANADGSGYGLGLTIVKRLCNQFGWTLTIRSKLGEGTCISVTFPKGQRMGGGI